MIAEDLAKGWQTASIGSICRVVRGSSPRPKGDPRYYSGPIPRLMVEDLTRDGRQVTPQIDSLTETGASLSRPVPAGTIVMVVSGNVGRVAQLTIDACIHDGFVGFLDLRRDLVDEAFLLHCLESQKHLHERNIAGAIWKNITTDQIKGIQLPIPPLPAQRRIAAILDKADAIRRKREEGIRLTEELLRSTFLEMFGDPATNPKGWPTGKLGELSSIRRGSSPRPIENYMGGDVPWIKIGDATKGDSFYITETEDHVTQAGAAKSVLLDPGSLVIANSGVSLGFARILKIKGCVHDGWLSVENLDERLNKVYLLKLINCLTDHFRAIAPEGTQPNLNTGIMKEYPIPMPPIDLQRKFEKAAFATVELTATRKKAAAEAEALFCSIVQRAFRGELTNEGRK